MCVTQQPDTAYIDGGDLCRAWQQALPAGAVAQARVVTAALQAHPHLEYSTAARIGPIIAGFAARQAALGRHRLIDTTPDDAAGFVWARTRRGHLPSNATVHLRRTALRMLARTVTDLGQPMADPTAELQLPSRTRCEVRPIDDDELGLLRITATARVRGRLETMATLALAEATATTGEIAQLTWGAIDLTAATVELPGAGRVRPRTGRLTRWGTTALTQLTETAPSSATTPMVYRGRAAAGSQASQAAIVNRLRRLIRAAGLVDPDLRPNSVRLWPAANLLDVGGSIEQAALLLGNASLDVTAAQLNHRWQA